MEKSADAFRTISEVAEVLETPAHVLRFWESRFPQIRPVKRAGGRRYYRPADVALLAGIRRLLHDEGMTIRGVQKILREQGVRHVASMTGAEVVEEPAIGVRNDVEDAELVQPGFAFDEGLGEVEPPVADVAAPEDADALPEALDATEPAAAEDLLPEDTSVAASALEWAERPEEAPAAAEAVELAVESETTAESEAPPFDAADQTGPAPPESPASLTEPDEAEAVPGVWVPTLLRAVPPGALAARRDALLPLHARLVALRESLASAHRGTRR